MDIMLFRMFQGMKMSPRFREGTAFIRTRYQPPHIKYPLLGIHIVGNVEPYQPEQLNIKHDVCKVFCDWFINGDNTCTTVIIFCCYLFAFTVGVSKCPWGAD